MKNFLTRINDKDNGLSFFGDVFDDFFRPSMFRQINSVMKTDVKNTDKGYELAIELAGYDKDEINVEFDKGYLTVSAKRQNLEEGENGYVRRERSQSCSRSYFVGENVNEEDIKAKYENGILTLNIPKQSEKQTQRKIQID